MDEKKLQEYISKGMRYPAINSLIEKAGNKYALVLAAAKRAREITDGDDALIQIDIDNAVSVATAEISEDLVHICHIDDLPKQAVTESDTDQQEIPEENEQLEALQSDLIGDVMIEDIILD